MNPRYESDRAWRERRDHPDRSERNRLERRPRFYPGSYGRDERGPSSSEPSWRSRGPSGYGAEGEAPRTYQPEAYRPERESSAELFREPEGEAGQYFGTGDYGSGGSAFTGGRSWTGRETPRYQPGYDDEWDSEARPARLWQQVRRGLGLGPKGYKRSDERINEDVHERLFAHPYVDSREVIVTVLDSNVTLEGTVTDRRMKHEIENLVEDCIGVSNITNNIRVERPTAGAG